MTPNEKPTGHKKQANKPAKKENDKGHSRADSDGKTPEHKKEKAPDKTKK